MTVRQHPKLEEVRRSIEADPSIGDEVLATMHCMSKDTIRRWRREGVVPKRNARGRGAKSPVRVEVRAYRSAPWAPRFNGCVFDWAWRVLAPCNQEIVCACLGKKEDAQRSADRAAERLAKLIKGDHRAPA